MELVANSIGQSAEKLSDIGSSSSVEEHMGVIADNMGVEPDGCDSASIMESNLDGAVTLESVPSTEQQKMEDIVCNETELEEQNEPMDLSDSIQSANPSDASKSSVVIASDNGDEPKLPSVEGLEQTETNDNVDSESELKVDTSLETENFAAVSDLESPISPADSTTDAAPIAPLVNTDGNVGANTTTEEEPEVTTHSLPPKKGFRFRSNRSKVSAEAPTSIPVFHQKGILKSKKSVRQPSSSMALSSLPIDSLHSIASFLKPLEWRNFGQCNKATNKICREIFRRVRMHGFRCATEVVTAWVSYSFCDCVLHQFFIPTSDLHVNFLSCEFCFFKIEIWATR